MANPPGHDVIVRAAVLEDARGIATVQVRGWQTAYRGIVPVPALDAMSIDEREARWHKSLLVKSADTWVAVEGSTVVGWASAGRGRDQDVSTLTGELWAIYVHPSHWRKGVGLRLWTTAAEDLRESGYAEATVWVLKDNLPARAFYQRVGFHPEPELEKQVELGGAQLLEVRLRNHLK